ncbi:MAG: HupE/UreJ family protein [Verrucomicrobiae bacterium]|nr:HupE/UreJ family protein [Verrucomicrobiae bacterium]
MKLPLLPRTQTRTVCGLLALFMPLAAFAHPGHTTPSGFAHGFVHPFGGWDHLLAMLAVGLWAAQLGGRARWALPACFLGVMVTGGTFATLGWTLPMAEGLVLTSVFVLGLLLMTAVRAPLWLAASLTALFAIGHGQAHGAEMGASATGLAYASGFVVATAILHGLGVAVGLAAQRGRPLRPVPWLRFAGVAVVLAGGAFVVAG